MKYCKVFLCLFLCFPLLASATTPSISLDKKINILLQETLPQGILGIAVIDPATHKLVYSRNENSNFYPASNTKLLTASAALQLLGPDYTYETRLCALPAQIRDNALNGDLHVVFSGDPSLTSADLKALFQQLKAHHVLHIKGNIIIDDTAFQKPLYAPGWTHDSIIWAYSAPISAIIIDENKVTVAIDKPKESTKSSHTLSFHQQRAEIPVKIDGHLKGVPRETAKNRCQIHANSKDNHIHLDGCYALEDTPTVLHLAIDCPRLLAQNWIEKNIADLNISMEGKILFGNTPANIPTFIVKKSPPLKTLLEPVLSDSNNVYAESITKTLGNAYNGKGTFQSGTRAIQAILEKNSAQPNIRPQQLLPSTQYRIEDGSGQSRYNLISPLALCTLLDNMQQNPYREAFQQALSVGGIKGTLAERMQQPDLKGKVFAKTGGASGTSTLSGYLISKSGKPYVFSIMLNQLAENNYAKTKAFEDKLCELLAEEPWMSRS